MVSNGLFIFIYLFILPHSVKKEPIYSEQNKF